MKWMTVLQKNVWQLKKPIRTHQTQKYLIFWAYKPFNNVMTWWDTIIPFTLLHLHFMGHIHPFQLSKVKFKSKSKSNKISSWHELWLNEQIAELYLIAMVSPWNMELM
jgi:hypothetical protein